MWAINKRITEKSVLPDRTGRSVLAAVNYNLCAIVYTPAVVLSISLFLTRPGTGTHRPTANCAPLFRPRDATLPAFCRRRPYAARCCARARASPIYYFTRLRFAAARRGRRNILNTNKRTGFITRLFVVIIIIIFRSRLPRRPRDKSSAPHRAHVTGLFIYPSPSSANG